MQYYNIIKRKPFLFVYSLKKNLINIIFICFTLLLVCFSNSCLVAAKSSLKLWANNVVPALFPFFIATELLSYTNLCNFFSKLLNKIIPSVFKVPSCGAYAFILGIISGYPVGAKVVTDLRDKKLCTQDEGSRLLAFTNNSGPLFIIGTVGISFFRNSTIGILLLITHFLSAITVGVILGLFNKSQNNIIQYSSNTFNKTLNFSDIGDVLKSSIINSIKNILLIGGFIVLFAVLISILESSHIFDLILTLFHPLLDILDIDILYFKGILTGFLEITNGISIISSIVTKNISFNIVLCSFLLGFGGLSILFQVLSIISKSDLSIKPYIYGKLLQGIIAATYTFIFINAFSFFNFNL